MSRIASIVCILVLFLCGLPGAAQQHTATPLRWPPAPQKARIEFLYAFSGKQDLGIEKPWWKKAVEFIFGEDKEVVRLDRPQAIAVRNDGRIYVTDPPSGVIHVFDFNRKEYKVIRSGKQCKFVSPVGVAVGTDDRVYIADSELRSITVFDRDENFLFSFPSSFVRPTGLYIRDGLIYVVDTGVHAVVVCDATGTEVRRFGHRGAKPAEYNYPVALCSSPSSKDQLCIVDALNFRAQLVTSEGVFLHEFGKMGDAPGDFGRPKGAAADRDGHIYITDALYDVTQVFDAEGKVLMAFGGSGAGYGKFSLPTGIAIDATDKIYVVDSGNQRVQVFQYLR